MANGEIVIDITLDDGSVVRGLADIDSQLNDLGGSAENASDRGGGAFKKLAGAAAIATGSIAGIGAAVGAAIVPLAQASASAQALNSQFTQVFGNLEDEATKSLNNIATETNILPERLKGTFAQIAAFAKVSGSDTAGALDIASRATLAAADSAAFYDTSIESITESLQSYLKGNYENDSALGISSTETTRNAKANELYGKSFDKLSESQKQLTLLAQVEDGNKLSGALGQAAREGEGLENVIGNLSQAWENLKSTLGQYVLQPVISGIVLLTKAIQTVDIESLVSKFSDIKNVVQPILYDFIAVATSVFSRIRDVITPIVQTAIDTVVTKFREVQTFWQNNGEAIISRIITVFNSLSAIVVPIVRDAIDLVTAKFKEVQEFWDTNGQQILQAVTNVFNGILAVIQFVMPAIQVIVEFVWTAIKNIFTGALDVIQGALKVFSGLFTGDWSKLWEGVKQLFEGAINLILGIMSLTFLGGIRAALVNFGKLGINLVKNAWSSIVAGFRTGTTQTVNIVSNFVGSVIRFIQNLSRDFINVIGNLALNVVRRFADLGNSIRSTLGSINLYQIGRNIIQGLLNGIGGLVGAVTDKVKSIANGIKNAFKSALDINSPSRVFQEYGQFISQGLAIGINDDAGKVQKAVQNLAATTTKTAQDQIQGIQRIVSASNKVNAAEIKAIQQASASSQLQQVRNIENQIANLRSKNAKANAKQVAANNAQIQKLQAQLNSGNLKTAADNAKKIAAIEATISSDRLTALKNDAEARLQAGQLNADAEVAYWKYALTAFNKGSKEYTAVLKLYNDSVAKLDKQRLDNVKDYIADKKSLDQLSLKDEVLIWEANLKVFKNGSNERLQAQKLYRDSLKALNDEVVSINSDYQKRIQEVNENVIKSEAELTKSYQDAVNSRTSSLLSFSSTFDEFVVDNSVSGSQLLNNLQSQVNGITAWQEEFRKLSRRGINNELLNELSDLGVKALPELLALNSLTDDQLTTYSNLYGEKSRLAREQAESELVGLKNDVEFQIGGLRIAAAFELEKLQDEWALAIKGITQATTTEFGSLKRIGQNAGNGLLEGLKSTEGPLVTQAKIIAENIKRAITTAFDINSPSRFMRDYVAGNLAKGFYNGVDKYQDVFTNASNNISSDIKSGITNTTRGATPSFGNLNTPSVNNYSNIYNNSTGGNGDIVITSSPILIDGQKVADVTFQATSRNQQNSINLQSVMAGVNP